MEVITEAYILQYECDQCKEGFMKRSDEPHPSDTLEFNLYKLRHRCDNCKCVRYYNEVYPFIYVPDFEIRKIMKDKIFMFYWLSFCDPDLPKGTKFLGGCIVKSDTFHDAIVLAHRLKINPGGEVMGSPISPDIEIPKEYINKLLSRADIERFDSVMMSKKP